MSPADIRPERRFRPAARRHPGFITGQVLLGLILMAGAASAFALSQFEMAGTSTMTRVGSEVPAQANLIRQQISNCVINYATPAASSGRPYPENAAGSNVRDLLCPNAPAGRQALFGGFDGVFLPQPPAGFSEWTYHPTFPSGEIYIQTSIVAARQNSQAYQQGLVQALSRFTATEAIGLPNNINPTGIRIWIRR